MTLPRVGWEMKKLGQSEPRKAALPMRDSMVVEGPQVLLVIDELVGMGRPMVAGWTVVQFLLAMGGG